MSCYTVELVLYNRFENIKSGPTPLYTRGVGKFSQAI